MADEKVAEHQVTHEFAIRCTGAGQYLDTNGRNTCHLESEHLWTTTDFNTASEMWVNQLSRFPNAEIIKRTHYKFVTVWS